LIVLYAFREIKTTKLVDLVIDISLDAGSIPATSTIFWVLSRLFIV